MRLFYRFSRGIFYTFFRLCYRHKVYGTEHLIGGRAIIAPNHASYFDPPLVAVSSTEEVSFLARKSLFSFPLFGTLIRSLNAHPVSGSAEDLGSIKLICRLLNEDKKVVIFPEGIRTPDGTLSEIKPGIGMLAIRCHAPVIPVYLSGTYDAWNKREQFPKIQGKTSCVFGSAIDWQPYAAMDKKQGQEAMAKAVGQAIGQLKRWLESGAQGTPP
jgi:1-acyl-sn-glycerol-3-phosphate acyltransferase